MTPLSPWAELPPWISLRGLAVELCPAGRPLNDFKQELRRILRQAGVDGSPLPGSQRKRFALSELRRRAPWVIETWLVVRQNRINP